MNSIPKNFLLIFVVLSTITACNRNTSIETQTQPNPPTRDCSVTPPCTIQDLKITKTLNVGTATITDATFNNDGNIIANSSAYNFVFDRESSELKQTLPSGIYSPNGKYLIHEKDSDLNLFEVIEVKTAKSIQEFTADSFTISPDSNLIAVYHTTDDKLVNEIRDLNTWKVVQDLLHLTPSIINEFPEFYLTYGQIYGISPDGKYLASLTSVSCAKGEPCIIYELSIVSLTTGETLTSNKFTGSVFGPLKNTVQFSPNGKFLAANGQEPNLFRVTDGGNLELIKSYSTYSSNIIFSKDSQFLVLENMLVNSTNGETVLDFKNPYFGRYTISPDSNTLAGLQENTNLINLWSTSGELVKVIESNHTASIQSLEFNSDGTQLLSSSADGTVKLWDVSTASLLNTFTGYSSYVEKMVLSPDEKMLAINSSFQEGSSKAIVQLWNLESKELVQELKSTGLLLSDMVFSPDSSMLATGNTEGINIWQVSSGQLLQTYSKPFIFSTKLGFSKDNSVLGIYTSHISSEEPNFNPESLFKLAFMEVSSGQILDEFNYQNVIFDSNSNFYAARELASIDTLQIFDMNTRERIQSISSLSGKTEFSNTGEQLVSIRGQTIDIRNIATGEIVSSKTIDSTHNFSLSNTASFFSPDISQIASQHKTNQTQIKLWSTQTGQLLHELTGHHSESPIIFTTDGTKLIVGSGHSDHNNTITIYSTPNSNPVFTNQSTN